MEREGWDALRPHEKVELVLNYAVPRQNLSDVARALVARFGSVGGVFSADREQLLAVEGMTDTLAEWVEITGGLMRAYYDIHAESDQGLSCFQEVLAFLKPRLAGAAVLCGAIGCALLVAIARRRNGSLGLRKAFGVIGAPGPLLKMLGASILMGFAVAAAKPLVSNGPAIAALAVLIALGAVVYGVLSLLFMREQLRGFHLRFRRRI